ncbi:2-oxo-4-hydroxy-4-carboxy-5-ureidoimidazoline decarboxylase [Frankliniella occidentalis]|uniref:2-oxo-4-hydroxy-4-carboxy-5-ureidoimidazoline decarboxylase n=1 Tax=Frankliniella occidentalis TaxID=133901 RepID=A0A6J1RXZ9_FRAOC|nr:2-oxo-4-hydroxy-4-carboxy-5-ureidoimidazoline decarboxylase [Frankliniella occidentalis]
MLMGPISMTAVNLLEPAEFTRVFGNVVELAPSIGSVLARRRPLKDVQHLLTELNTIIDGLSDSDKVDILRRHPDLAGVLAEKGLLTTESTAEQKSAGLDQLTEQQKYDLQRMNKSYRDKFGFPFVICARENKAVAILEGLTTRMINTRERELDIGIGEVKKIARLRVCDLVMA